MDKPKRVIPVDFQACFKYTLLAKIAPMWNTVAGYLIQGNYIICILGIQINHPNYLNTVLLLSTSVIGRDFLTMNKKFSAIGMYWDSYKFEY